MGQAQVRTRQTPAPPPKGSSQVPSTPAPRPARGLASRAHLERRTVAGAALLIIGVWLVVVFAGVLAEADRYAAAAAAANVKTEELRAEVAAGRAEIATIQTDSFRALQARAYGYGTASEHAFALRPGAPPPPDITPLGSAPAVVDAAGPSDDWLGLLLGR